MQQRSSTNEQNVLSASLFYQRRKRLRLVFSFKLKCIFGFQAYSVTFFVLYNMCNIVSVMHWCFDRINKSHSNYFISMPPIGHMDWIGFRKLDPRATLITITAATTTTTTTKSISIIAAIIFIVIMERMRRN